MSAQRVLGKLLPPLDEKLALRADHWSGGVARVATRLGLQAKSFDLAAAGFSAAVGVVFRGIVWPDSPRIGVNAWKGNATRRRPPPISRGRGANAWPSGVWLKSHRSRRRPISQLLGR